MLVEVNISEKQLVEMFEELSSKEQFLVLQKLLNVADESVLDKVEQWIEKN